MRYPYYNHFIRQRRISMYFTKNLYQTYAKYHPMDSQTFMYKMCYMAYQRYQNGRKLKKSEAPVVYGSSVKDFNPDEDDVIARVEMNDRGVLRDFIGIDWDFDKGDEDKFQTLFQNLGAFAKKYQTFVYVYATHSYPKKPRVRTVMFTQNEMNGAEYAKAVTFVEDALELSHHDDGNYDIKHNFNLPVINNKAQLECMTFFMRDDFDKLDNQLWSNVKPKQRGYAQNMKVRVIPVSPMENNAHSDKNIQRGLKHLSERMKAGTNKKLDFDIWSNFFQFLHAVARAEVLGAITHEQALYILKTVAGGNSKWAYKNIEDYHRELPRVKSNKEKLERARLLSYYFGDDFYFNIS